LELSKGRPTLPPMPWRESGKQITYVMPQRVASPLKRTYLCACASACVRSAHPCRLTGFFYQTIHVPFALQPIISTSARPNTMAHSQLNPLPPFVSPSPRQRAPGKKAPARGSFQETALRIGRLFPLPRPTSTCESWVSFCITGEHRLPACPVGCPHSSPPVTRYICIPHSPPPPPHPPGQWSLPLLTPRPPGPS
jgi:hypothetical protein